MSLEPISSAHIHQKFSKDEQLYVDIRQLVLQYIKVDVGVKIDKHHRLILITTSSSAASEVKQLKHELLLPINILLQSRETPSIEQILVRLRTTS